MAIETINSDAHITKAETQTINSNALIYDPKVPREPYPTMNRTDHTDSTDGKGYFKIY